MTDKKNVLKRRKAWIFEEQPPLPGLADLFGGPERRAAFSKYWLKQAPGDAFDLFMYFGLKLVPMNLCSDIGAAIGRFSIPRWYKAQEKRARANLKRLRPDLDDAGREALYQANCDFQGRIMTEFSIVNRLARTPGRLVHDGTHHIAEALKDGPVILIGMHLGNWELVAPGLMSIGIRLNANYTPPPRRARAWIVSAVRKKAGIGLLPPGQAGVRPALQILKEGGVVSIFCDEGVKGKLRGPLFGRKPHMEGNLAMAVRFARLSGARLCPYYTLRTGKARFVFRSQPAITLPPEERPGARLMEDILMLNGVIEPIVRANLDQWYYLDNEIKRD